MIRWLTHPILLWVIRLILGGVFLYAGLPKLWDLASFAESVDNYRIIPLEWVPAFATCLAGIEVITGLALVTGIWRKGASLMVGMLLWMFVIAIFYVYLDGRAISCGCGLDTKSAQEVVELRSDMITRIVQDIVMLLMAAHLFWQEWTEKTHTNDESPDTNA